MGTNIIVGKPLTRVDSFEKVMGKATYGTDVVLPGMLYGKFLRSPHAHAHIKRVAVEAARAIPGVYGLVTGKDIDAYHGANIIKDQPFLAIDRVRYIGEPVVGVVADHPDTCDRALEAVQVEYEPLPGVFDPREAMQPGSVLIHEDLGSYKHADAVNPVGGTNICTHFKLRKGDVEQGLAESWRVFENTYFVPMIQHTPMEPHAAVAQVDYSGKLTVWSNTQSPFHVRGELARALNLPMSKVRVIGTRVGGGFGAKHEMRIEHLAVALAYAVPNRPIKVVLTREEEFVTTLVRMPVSIKLSTGVSREGRLLARKVEVIWDTGAYSGFGPIICRNAGLAASGPYAIPHVHVDSHCVYTNKPLGGAFRGFGVPEIAWAYETQMDVIALELGLDPLEIRMMNALEAGDSSPTGEIMGPTGLKECLEKAAEAIDWHGEKANPRRGKGIACIFKTTGTPSSSSVIVRVNEDGTAVVLTGAVDLGQGSDTLMVQIAAEELGITPDRIVIMHPDTDFSPYERSTTGSRLTFHAGNAARSAAIDARNQILDIAADILEASADDLEVGDNRISVKGSPDRWLSIKDVWQGEIYEKRQQPIIGRATFSTSEGYERPDPETGQSKKPTAFWMVAAQAVEVEVDPDTGEVTVIKCVAAHDVGKAINPLTCEQQVEGGVVQGLGAALYEELIVDKGKVVNPSFLDYKIPTIMDIPEVVPILIEEQHPVGPYGAIGLGEPTVAPTPPAVGNAVFDAVGVRIDDLPLTPEKVRRHLKSSLRTGGNDR